MPNSWFLLLMVPLVHLAGLRIGLLDAKAILLTALVILGPRPEDAAALPASILPSGYGLLQPQAWVLVQTHDLVEAVLVAVLAAVALAAVVLSRARRQTEGELRESEVRYRLLFEGSPHPAWVYDRQTLSFLAVNEAAVRRYGYSREEFLSMTIKDIRPPEDVPALLDLLARGGQPPADKLWRHRKKDGSLMYVEVTAAELSFGGRPAELVLAHDITERVQAEEALRRSESDYRNLFEQAHDAIIIFLPECETVIDVNERACEMYGFTRDEFIGMPLASISRDIARGRAEITATLRRGAHFNFETAQYRKDGTEMHLEVNASVISYQGRTAILSINRDITERVRAERARLKAEEKYRSIFENAVEGIFQSTPEGRFISVNPAMARMFGFDSPEEMLSERTDIERQHYVDPSRRAEMKRTLEERGVVLGFVAEAYRKDGSAIWTSSNTRAVRDAAGAVCYYEGFVEDITDRVRADEWEQRQKRLAALRADVSAAFATGRRPLRDILRQSAEAMVKHLDVAFARIWTLNQAEGVLELQASAGIYTRIDGTHARIPVGSLKVGRIAEERAPHLTNDLQGDERVSDKEWARREGLVSFAGHPLLVEGRLVGVMAMFARRPLRPDKLDALSFIADTIAQGVERVRAEETLRERRAFLRQIIDTYPHALFVKDSDERFVLANQATADVYGTTAENLIGKTDADFLLDEEMVERFHRQNRAVRETGEKLFIPEEPVVVQKTGEVRWFETIKVPLASQDGVVRRVLGTATDITERKRAEEAVRRSEERLRAFVAASSDVVYSMSADWGEMHYLDGKDFITDTEGPSDSWLEKYIHPDDQPRVLEAIREAIRTKSMFELEHRVRRADGTLGWTLSRAVPLLDESGEVVEWFGAASDVTERRRAEEALRQSEERNRATLKAIPDLIFLQTRDGVYLDYQAKDVGELLLPPESFLGKNMRDVLPPELAEKFQACFECAIRHGEMQVCEYTALIGGQQRSYEARIVACDGDKILTVVRDVTAHRLAEKQRTQLLRRLVSAQEEERARLAREVHDEFAAYLSAIKWAIESLQRAEERPRPAPPDLSYLLGLTAQLQHKVRDFAFELSPAELDDKDGLPPALDRYVRRWAERAGGRVEAEFRCDGFDAALRLPREAETAVYRVTQEALTNVLKHADARRVTVTLGYHAAEPGRGVVRLTVEDDGAGFEQAAAESAERGLGLKGMGERAALVGGTLEVKSDRGGTKLVMSVPA